MATRFVASGGDNSDGSTWAKAYNTLAGGISASTGDNDILVIQYNAVPAGDKETAADTTYTFAGNIQLISASNDGGSAFTPRAMGTDSDWIGNSTTARSLIIAGADKRVRVYGVTFRNGSTTNKRIDPAVSNGQHMIYESCYIWNNAYAGQSNSLCAVGTFVEYINCTLRLGSTGQYAYIGGNIDIRGGTFPSADGSTPAGVIYDFTGGAHTITVRFSGVDMSLLTTTFVPNTGSAIEIWLDRCKLGAGLTLFAAQTTNPDKASANLWVMDCNSGDTHGIFGYYNALGSVVSDTSIYTTAGAAAQSWKIVTTANATKGVPFETPWIQLHSTGTSAITPYLELVRSGSATAYKDNEVWAEVMCKTTSGYTIATYYADKASLGSAGADQATGGLAAGDWTGENATSWFGKIDSGAAITPAEVGSISMRVCVGIASKSDIYIDPQIRT